MTYLVKTTLEASFALGAVIPFFVDDAESNVLIRRTGDEADQACVVFAGGRKRLASLPAVFALNLEGWGFGNVDEIWVEKVEAVALHDLWWRVVVVVVSLVVLVPFVAQLNSVEVSRLAGLVLVGPRWGCEVEMFFGGESLFVVQEASGSLALVQGAGCARGIVVVAQLTALTGEGD